MSGSLLVVGGAHIDRRGRIAGTTVMGASNPGRWFEEPGGGGFNAARNLARLGHEVRLIAPRGGDAAGIAVSAEALRVGIDDCPVVFLDRATPSYTAILEADGNLVIALADMELYDLFGPRRTRTLSFRAALGEARHVLCDANLPAETLTALADAAAARGLPVFAIAISPAKVVRLLPCFTDLTMLFMNAAEAEALTGARPDDPAGWPALLREKGLKGGVVTCGAEAVVAFDETETAILSPPRLDSVVDVTGAGDAFASGVISACIGGCSLGEALRHGAALAAITLRSPHATAENLSRDLANSYMPLVPDAKILS
ncbi:carbohydrate kinase family protein [Ciceribacter sp. RN22]|uniref:carbohydrate kinase family protein n=1 Tax=Ciceribacter sp. RN22 TaxID=2954932 RepID=UPI002093003E|nr:carbohydrate kinase family protein [Ciceribacter sp. RN22]MCO6178571.1 carbohydrate kinase family protein [Ciceribacter sp. RN22]